MEPVLPWYEEDKETFELEIQRFKDYGIDLAEDAIQTGNGILTIDLVIPVKSKMQLSLTAPLKLKVVYPDLFPFFKPEVYASDILLPRHQHPIHKNLCLLPRTTGHWIVGQPAADYINEQLPKVLVKGVITDQEVIGQDPDEQAEPLSDYFKSRNVIIMSTFPQITAESNLSQGTLRFRLDNHDKDFSFEEEEKILKLIIPTWKDSTGKVIEQTQGPSQYEVPWVRVSRIPIEDKERRIFFDEKIKQFQFKDLSPPIKIRNGRITKIFAIVFPEELTSGTMDWGWIFVLVYTLNKQPKTFYQVVAGRRTGKNDYSVRIPKLQEFGAKTISIAGLGSLGAPSAIEFAKNGIKELRLLDYDTIEPSSTVRYPLGIKYAGLDKGKSLKQFIEENYPSVKVNIFTHRIGMPRDDVSQKSEKTILREFLADTSLIYDCTGEIGIANFLFYEARLSGIPYISISATPGVWGGLITRSIPSQDRGCWLCFQNHLTDGTIPSPPQDPSGDIQAAGCGDKTFTGASFELQNIMLAGVRLAASTLCKNDGGYPDVSWDAAVLSLVNKETREISSPTWDEYKVEKHKSCAYCKDKQDHLAQENAAGKNAG